MRSVDPPSHMHIAIKYTQLNKAYYAYMIVQLTFYPKSLQHLFAYQKNDAVMMSYVVLEILNLNQ